MHASIQRVLGARAGQAAALVTITAALAAFLLLQSGHSGGGGAAVGYAETIHRAIGPVSDGRVEAVLVHVGQPVKAGDVVALADGSALRLARERSVAQLAKLTSEVSAAALDVESQVTRSELWGLRARADEKRDRAALGEASGRMNRLESLLSRQMISATEVEGTRERFRSLQARVSTYDDAMRGGHAALLSAPIGDHERSVDVRVDPSRQAVAVQEAALAQLDLAIRELSMRATADGVVSAILHTGGEVVAAGTEIVSVVSTRPGVVVAYVPEQLAQGAVIGRTWDLRRRFRYFSPVYRAHVIEVAPEIEQLPARAWPSPGIPTWGRRALLELDGPKDTLPGEAFNVTVR